MKIGGWSAGLDISDEINACSIVVEAEIDGKKEEWLVMFKNETHNHPTEIEPFGGAATCLGGAIRDPLSGRVYVYQAMRVTGSGDPRASIAALPGTAGSAKLPRCSSRLAVRTAICRRSYRSGGEIYDQGFIATPYGIGAVIGATESKCFNSEP